MCRINFILHEASYVIVKVVDIIGNEVTTLINEKRPPGEHVVDFNGTHLTAGFYYYKIFISKNHLNGNSEIAGNLFKTGQINILAREIS